MSRILDTSGSFRIDKCIATHLMRYMSRAHSIRMAQGLYRKIKNDGVCVYCGEIATQEDHFVPLAAVVMLLATEFRVKGRVILPSCAECNRIAGDSVFPTVAAKKRFIHRQLVAKNIRLLAAPDWSDAQLSQLGDSLKQRTLASLARRKRLIARLAWKISSNLSSAELVKIRSNLGASGSDSAPRNADLIFTQAKTPGRDPSTGLTRGQMRRRQIGLKILAPPRFCIEPTCSERLTKGKERFCSAECRKTYQNRRLKRGAMAYEALMLWRRSRGMSASLGDLSALADRFISEDVQMRAGRK